MTETKYHYSLWCKRLDNGRTKFKWMLDDEPVSNLEYDSEDEAYIDLFGYKKDDIQFAKNRIAMNHD